MTTATTPSSTADGLRLLRVPFPREQVGKLPKKNKDGSQILLDYVGHADCTARILDADPLWTWEPLALDPNGLPLLDSSGNLWIRLTVCGVTRLGVGDGASIKEKIGDCLVRDTPVVTDRGIVPIQDVRVGDRVPTRQGWHLVTDHWRSSAAAPIVAVLLADGRVLAGTPHHKVPTANGVSRLSALRNGDMMFTWLTTACSQAPTRSFGTDAATADTQTANTGHTAPTTWPRQPHGATCTATSTKTPSALSLTVSTFTTSTTTQPTTAPRTSRCCPPPTTPHTTKQRTSALLASATSADGSTWPTVTGPAGAPLPARNADDEQTALPTKHLVSVRIGTRGSAQSVKETSSHASPGPASAQVAVVAVLDAGLAEVWNLSVGDVHEYVANGLVVHNSIRNAAMRFGVALDLWAKGDRDFTASNPPPLAYVDQIVRQITALPDDQKTALKSWWDEMGLTTPEALTPEEAADVLDMIATINGGWPVAAEVQQ